MENNDIEADDDVKKEKKDKSKFKSNSYKCQFCEKSFPRLGYLKKHEQVSLKIFAHVLTQIKLTSTAHGFYLHSQLWTLIIISMALCPKVTSINCFIIVCVFFLL